MIRRGKTEGWLSLPDAAFQPWMRHNDIQMNGVVLSSTASKGNGLFAAESLASRTEPGADMPVLLKVPRDLVLSLARVQEHAHVDKDLRELLESLGDSGRTARGAILCFLLVACSQSCPDLSSRVGVQTDLTAYVKSLPLDALPTFWSAAEIELLTGTSLSSALANKLKALHREYVTLRSAAARTRWYGIVQDRLDFDDWLQVDSMYRSRALDIPGIGHCMIPCVDLANHASGDAANAIYERDAEGNGVLLLRDGKVLAEGTEVTISYGDHKGACEMLFSYGFVDDQMKSTEKVLLGLSPFPDDPVAQAKLDVAQCAPGVQFFRADDGDSVDWTSDFIWLLCVNADDGLDFSLARTTDGREEVQASMQGIELTGGAGQLRQILAGTELWDVYQLRAVSILQQRVADQLTLMMPMEDHFIEDWRETDEGQRNETSKVIPQDVRRLPYEYAGQLHHLESSLLNSAYELLDEQKDKLAQSPVVLRYLANMSGEGTTSSTAEQEGAEDFA